MKHLIIVLISVGIWSCKGQSEQKLNGVVNEIAGKTTLLNQSEIAKLDSVNINFQFSGDCYAYSSLKNAIASNGEAQSDNLPKNVDKSFPREGFYLVINQNELSKIDSSILGCKLYLVNTTDSLIKFRASDSRLNIVAEALNDKYEWTEISYLPISHCGNSYHTVILDKDEYWSFDVPVFKGKIKTKLRYTLTIGENKKISSNEIVTYLNEGQFDIKNQEEYRNNNILNTY